MGDEISRMGLVIKDKLAKNRIFFFTGLWVALKKIIFPFYEIIELLRLIRQFEQYMKGV